MKHLSFIYLIFFSIILNAQNAVETPLHNNIYIKKNNIYYNEYTVCSNTSNTFRFYVYVNSETLFRDVILGSRHQVRIDLYSSSDNINWNLIEIIYQPSNSYINVYCEYDYSITLNQTQYYKVKTYITDGNFSVYKDCSNTLKITAVSSPTTNTVNYDQSVSGNTQPDVLVGNNIPTIANTSKVYEWSSSQDNSNYVAISNSNSQTYQPSSINQTTYYRRYAAYQLDINDQVCNFTPSNTLTISYSSIPDFNIFSTNSIQLCYGESIELQPDITGNFTYQWQRSYDGIWLNIPGATSRTYNLINDGSSFLYEIRLQITSSNGTNHSNTLIVFAEGYYNPGIISSSQVIDINTQPAMLTGPTMSYGEAIYQWQESNDAIDWIDINGATGVNFQPPTLNEKKYYRRMLTAGIGAVLCSEPSNSIFIDFYEQLIEPTITDNQQICYNSIPNILSQLVLATGGDENNYTYQWQNSLNNVIWNDIPNANEEYYQPPALLTNRYFRLKVTSGTQSVYSNHIHIGVDAEINLNSNVPNGTICGDCPLELEIISNIEFENIEWKYRNSNPNGTGQGPFNISNFNSRTLSIDNVRDYKNEYFGVSFYAEVTYNSCVTATSRSSYSLLQELTPGIIGNNQTIDYNTIPERINGSLPNGGYYPNPTEYTYQWQRSTDNEIWQNIPNARNQNYQPPALIETTYFRRLDISNQYPVGCNSYTNEVEITVIPEISTIFLIEGDQTICYGTRPNYITQINNIPLQNFYWIDAETGYNLEYLNLGDGYNSEFHFRTALHETLHVKLIGSYAPLDGSDYINIESNTITIRVLDQFNVESPFHDNSSLLCPNEEATEIQVLVNGGENNYTYQWQRYNDYTWQNIPNTNSNIFTPPVNQSFEYRLKIEDSKCGIRYSEQIDINYLDLSRTYISDNNTILCYNDYLTSLYSYDYYNTVSSRNVLYQWQRSTDNQSWNDIQLATNYHYTTMPPLTESTYFRLASYIDGCSERFYTNSRLLTVKEQIEAPVISTIQTEAICPGNRPAPIMIDEINLNACHTDLAKQVWLFSHDNIFWQPVTSSTGDYILDDNLTIRNFQPNAIHQTTYYRLRIGNYPNFVSSNTIVINVHNDSYSYPRRVYPTSDRPWYCMNANNYIEYEQLEGFSYQWQQRYSTLPWNDIPYENSHILNIENNLINDSYRLVLSNECTEILVAPIVVNFYDNFAPGTISIDNNIICANETPSQIIGVHPSGGNTFYNFQWQQSTNGNTWTDIIGATGLNYQPPALTETTSFRRIDKEELCNIEYETNVITINIASEISNNSIITNNQTICYNTIPAILEGSIPTGGTGNYRYGWQFSHDNVQWNSINNSNSQNYQPTALTQTTYFRRVCTDDNYCSSSSLFSSEIVVNVYDEINGGTIVGNETISYNRVPSRILGTTPTGGGAGNFTYLWQRSNDNETWFDIESSNTLNYQPDALNETTYFRRKSIKNNCEGYSNTIIVTVYERLYPGNIGSNQQICYNTEPSILIEIEAPNGGTGEYFYQWQRKTETTNFVNIIGSTGLTYQSPPLRENTKFRRRVIASTSLDTSYSNEVTIDVHLPLNGGEIAINKYSNSYKVIDTICYNNRINKIANITEATDGKGAKSYLWQQSRNGFDWEDIIIAFDPVTTLEHFNSTQYRQSIKYRRMATDQCGSISSNEVSLIVLPEINNFYLPAPERRTICYNTTPSEIEGYLPNGGTGEFFYQWQFSTDNSNYQNIPGANSQNYQSNITLRDTTYYRRITAVSHYMCDEKISNIYTIIVNPDLVSGIISDNQSVCYNSVPARINGTASSGGNGNYYYQWQYASDADTWNNIWNDISGATGLNYQPGALNETRHYRRKTTSNIFCEPVYSNIVSITVYTDLVAGEISGSRDVCHNTGNYYIFNNISTSGGTGNYTYQWQFSHNNINFYNIENATDILYFTDTLYQTTYYQRIDTDLECNISKPTNLITIDVARPIENVITNISQTLTSDQLPREILAIEPVGGIGEYEYLWQQSNNGVEWSNIFMANSITYQPQYLDDTTYFRRLVFNSCGTSTSNIYTVNIIPEIFAGEILTSTPYICIGNQPSIITGTPATGGTEIFRYQWQQSTDAIDWSNILNATSLNYQPNNLTSQTYFRRLDILHNYDTAITNIVSINIYSELIPSEISSSQEICFNTQPQKLITTNMPQNGANYTYQWQMSVNNIVFNDIVGATGIEFQPPVLSQTTYYRKKITSDCSIAYSNTIEIKVVGYLISGIISPFNQIIGYNQTPIPINGEMPISPDSYTYQWQFSNDSITWINFVTDARSQNYEPTNLLTTTYIRRLISNICIVDTSNIIKIEVIAPIENNIITSNDQIICKETIPAILEGSIPEGGNENFRYQWQQSTDAIDWSNILNATNINYQPTALLTNRYFRRIVYNEGFEYNYSNIIFIEVYSNIEIPEINENETICYGTTPTANTVLNMPNGGTENYTYQWQFSNDRITWNDIDNANTTNYYPSQLINNTNYRLRISDNCQDVFTSARTINVLGDLTYNIIASSTNYIYSNTTPSIIEGTLPIGGILGDYIYQWQQSTDTTNWNTIINENERHYQPPALNETHHYRRIVTNYCDIDTSNILTISVFPPVNNYSIGSSQQICNNTQPDVLVGTIPEGGDQNYTYQWQQSTDATNWDDILNANDRDYQPPVLNEKRFYRRKLSMINYEDIYSNIVIIDIYSNIDIPEINENETICYETTPTANTILNMPNGGTGNYTYQWQFSNDRITWNDIENANTTNYYPSELISNTNYRLKISDNCQDVFTSARSIFVNTTLENNQISPSIQNVIYNTNANPIEGTTPTGGGTDEIIYQWQQSYNNFNFSDIVNANERNYQPTSSNTTTFYRRIARRECEESISNTSELFVYNPVVAGTINNRAMIICYNTQSPVISPSLPTGCTGEFTYQWQQTNNINDSDSWQNIPNAIEPDYQSPALTETTCYRRVDISSRCGSSNTVYAQVEVLNQQPAPTVNHKRVYCENEMMELTIQNPRSINYYFYDENYNILSSLPYYSQIITEPLNIFCNSVDNMNCSSSYSEINVDVEKITIDFEPSVNNVNISTPIQFVPSVYNSNYTYSWEFFEGDNSSDINAWHYYNKEGIYDVALQVITDNGCSDYILKENLIHVNNHITNINEKSNLIDVYPNPVVNLLNINFQKQDFQTLYLYDSMKKEILKKYTKEKSTSIDFSNISSGIYFLKIENSSEILFIKIIK